MLGATIDAGERRLNAGGNGSRAAGAALTLALTGACAFAGFVVQRSTLASVVLGSSMLAARDLLGELAAIADALEHDDLERARLRVARIVGRDTAQLDRSGVVRAAIESLGESACDGIVAPLFWFALGGLPGALAFKVVNTLDSMIGHRDARFLRFGMFAARTDDALNYLPARLTAAFIALAAGASGSAARVALADASRHASPNAGWPEAALAGALGVQLGGSNRYAGVRVDGALFNAGARIAGVADVRRAMRIVTIVALLASACAVAVRA